MKIVSNCTNAIGTIKTPEGLRMLFISEESAHYLGRKCRTWSLEVRKEDGTVEDDGRMCFHGTIWADAHKIELSLIRKGRTVSSKHHKAVWQVILELFTAHTLQGQIVGDVVEGEARYTHAAPMQTELPYDALEHVLESAVEFASQEWVEVQEDGTEVAHPAKEHTVTHYEAYRIAVGRITVDKINELVGHELFTFHGIESPSDYTFHTDKLIATMPRFIAGKLLTLASQETKHHNEMLEELRMWMRETVTQELTPRSGFAPLYSTDTNRWPPFRSLPACLMGLLVRGYLEWMYNLKGQGIYESLTEWLETEVEDRLTSNGTPDLFISAEEG